MSLKYKVPNNRRRCPRRADDAILFPLGIVGATPGALNLLDCTGTNAAIFLDRHQRGDFGTVDTEDTQANTDAIEDGNRILSSYTIGSGRLWVITEANRASTTLLLPDGY